MIAFCTSLRAQAMSNDWAYHVWLLERTVASMLAQRGRDVCVVVGCHDVPSGSLQAHPQVHFERVSIELPARTFDDMSVDKVIKHSVAARWAIANGASYVAFNDADDLVSNRIGSLPMPSDGAGWYSSSQRFFTYGGSLSRLMQVPPPRSGPFVLVRSDALQFDAPPFSGEWVAIVEGGGEHDYLRLLARHQQAVCTLAAVGHAHYVTFMSRIGQPLQPLPFPANLVINHRDSMSTAGSANGYPVMSALGRLKRSLRWVPTLRVATSAIRREFHVPPDAQIPAPYRGGASVFWR